MVYHRCAMNRHTALPSTLGKKTTCRPRASRLAVAAVLGTMAAMMATVVHAQESTPTASAAAEADVSAILDNLDDVLAGRDATGTPPPPPPQPNEAQAAAEEEDDDRDLPNYDGREGEDGDATEVLIWVPRLLFAPVHLTLNYLVRWPLVKAITLGERYYIFERIYQFLTWDNEKAGIFPVALVDFGFNPSVGAVLFWDEFLAPNNRLDLSVSAWEGNWITASGRETVQVFRDQSGTLTLAGEFLRRPDLVFYGLGSNTTIDDEVQYRIARESASLELRGALVGLNRASFRLAYRHVDFSTDAESPSIDTAFDTTALPGFEDGYQLLEGQGRLEFDTRNPEVAFTPGTGLRLELFGGYGLDPTRTDTQFLRFGGEFSGYYDVTGVNHVLAMRVYGEFTANTGTDPIPFTELVSLGGNETMRGFLQGRFLGRSGVTATVSYRYPIWSFFDAAIFAEAGNVFDARLQNFAFDKLYLDWGMSLRTNTTRDVGLVILVAFGSNRLDRDTFKPVDNVRFAFGATTGF